MKQLFTYTDPTGQTWYGNGKPQRYTSKYRAAARKEWLLSNFNIQSEVVEDDGDYFIKINHFVTLIENENIS